MSIKIMSAIFEAKFMDLRDAAGNVTNASTAKLVLLALADHASDGGEGAYPGLTRVEGKTGLNRRTIINALDALKYNGIISLVGRSKHNTNNYTILMQALPVTVGNGVASTPPLVAPVHQDSVTSTPPLVAPVHQDGVANTPPLVAPVHLNHPLTTIKPSREDEEERTINLIGLEGLSGAVPQDISRLIDAGLEKGTPACILQATSLASDERAISPKYVDQDGKATLPVMPLDESSHLSEGLKPFECQDSSHLSGGLRPLELNHPLTILKPSDDDDYVRPLYEVDTLSTFDGDALSTSEVDTLSTSEVDTLSTSEVDTLSTSDVDITSHINDPINDDSLPRACAHANFPNIVYRSLVCPPCRRS